MSGGYDETHWAAAEKEVAELKERLEKVRPEDRQAAAMIEVAAQLMWLNAHLSALHDAVHRVADNH